MRLRLLTAVAAALLFGLTTGAMAHAHLKSSAPATGESVVGSPSELRLDFSEAIDIAFSGASLVAADGSAVPTGAARLGGNTQLVVPIAAKLAPGSYAVEWHNLAADGHRMQGRYVFFVTP